MDIVTDWQGRAGEIAALFERTFTVAEGEEEGRLVGRLARELLSSAPAPDLRVVAALEAGVVVGCVIFSRLRYPDDPRAVFLLSPVAVAPEVQGRGIGQALIGAGLSALRREGVDVAVTYGDPAYYGRLGFAPVPPDTVPPPHPLSHPEGWLAQALTDGPLAPLAGRSHCVGALADPAYW